MKQLNWGILGCASIAKRSVIPGIRLSEHNVVHAIASRSLEQAKATAEELQIPNYYGTYEELLRDPSIDVVYIPLPNHLHKEWSIKAMEAGKHVLCEKPLALNAKEAEEIAAVANTNHVMIAEAFMYRYHPRYEQMRQLVQNGEIGEVRLIRGSFTFNNGDSTENVRYVKEWGGGSLYDVGCYPISAARYILQSEPIAATAHGLFSEKHGGVDMMASGLIEFPNQVSLLFDCGMWAAFRNTLEIVGTLGTIEVPHAFVTQTEEECTFYIHKNNERIAVPAVYYNSYALQADAIAKAVYGEQPMPFPISDAISNMKAIDACLNSMENATRVKMN